MMRDVDANNNCEELASGSVPLFLLHHMYWLSLKVVSSIFL